jgi:hypothetical protein
VQEIYQEKGTVSYTVSLSRATKTRRVEDTESDLLNELRENAK